ncbi:MAG: MotA/TolQ/ExbB proton channel family protein [Gemmobacter sp.]
MPPATAAEAAIALLHRGGPAMWAIVAVSVVMLALVLWKATRLFAGGAWSGGVVTDRAVALWSEGKAEAAQAALAGRRSYRARLARAAMAARADATLTTAAAEAETGRVARALLAEARAGLRPLELIALIAPLMGLFGTVLGMIGAFAALEGSGARADPAILAGGIWEALLTTAAGIAVAIPASVALAWFEGVVERLRHDMEDAATRIFLRHPGAGAGPRLAAVGR